MRNIELIAKIYERCPKSENFANGHPNKLTIDQLFDRCLDIQDMIEMERPEIARNNLWKNKDNFWSGGHLEKK